MIASSQKHIDDTLLYAHETDDYARLVEGYQIASEFFLMQRDVDRACFYLTQAYVYALVSDHEKKDDINAILCQYGRNS